MAKTEKTVKPAVKTEEKPKRPYHRQMPIGFSKNRGERLKPILHSLIERNMSVTELALFKIFSLHLRKEILSNI